MSVCNNRQKETHHWFKLIEIYLYSNCHQLSQIILHFSEWNFDSNVKLTNYTRKKTRKYPCNWEIQSTKQLANFGRNARLTFRRCELKCACMRVCVWRTNECQTSVDLRSKRFLQRLLNSLIKKMIYGCIEERCN